jgi:hypothetical protein
VAKCQRVGIKKKVLTKLGEVDLPKTHPLCSTKSPFKITAKLQEEICMLGQCGVYREASELADALLNVSISDQQIRRVCIHYGLLVDALVESNIECMLPRLEDCGQKDPTYIMMDGSMLFTRDDGWKELKLARVFNGSKVIDIQDNRNEIVESIYCSHLGGVKEFFPKLERYVQGYNHLVVVADGAKWIWNWCEDNYPGCVQILDFYHAKEKLVLLANTHFNHQDKKGKWLTAQLELLKDDQVVQVVNNVKKMACRSEEAKKSKAKLIKYFIDHEDRMLYKTFTEKGYLIGSGPIEAAHRSVIQQRMKLSGQKWSIIGANAIANLRCYRKSNAWHIITNLVKACAA